MIFVTVGTHEQQFNRLVEYMDKWAEKHDEEVIIQTGFSTYEPQTARWRNFFSYDEMAKYIEVARIVITHGGPSSFIAPLQLKKTPLVVPRKKIYGEHVNDHQVKFCRYVAERIGTIIDVDDIDKLNDIIERYQIITEGMKTIGKSNNEKFCREFEKIVERMFR